MKKIILIVLMIFPTIVFSQITSENIKYFVGISYFTRGNTIYAPDNPLDSYRRYSENGINIKESSEAPDYNFMFGKKISPNVFLLSSLSFSYDFYKYGIEDSEIEPSISVTTISPLIGLKLFFKNKESIFPYFFLGLSKTIAFSNSKDWISPEKMEKKFEKAHRDMSSPLRGYFEFGIEYLVLKHLAIGLSSSGYFEYLSGKAINFDFFNNTYNIYNFSNFRIGQKTSLNLLFYF